MSRLKDIQESRLKLAKEAAERYQSREEHREALKEQGPLKGEDRKVVEQFQQRTLFNSRKRGQRAAPREGMLTERVFGPDDRYEIPRNEYERLAGRSVARIIDVSNPNRPYGYGTGFMVSARLLITNHHVLRDQSDALISAANFGHEYSANNVIQAGENFALDPATCFYNNRELDFALVAVSQMTQTGVELKRYGWNRLIGQTGKILVSYPINIIQHPKGGHKRYATEGNLLVDRLDDFLHYMSDTDPGSSGSPCFNDFWDVVALHRSAVPRISRGEWLNKRGEPWTEDQGVDAIDWVANEGVRISRILEHLAAADLSSVPGATLIRELLEAGSAPEEAFDPHHDGVEQEQSLEAALNEACCNYGDARTIVHVHGDAKVHTGDAQAHMQKAHLSSDPGSPERQRPRLEKKLRFDPDYSRRPGYDVWFLREVEVGLPMIDDKRKDEIFNDRHGNPVVLDYHHYSLVMNEDWQLTMWTASNVDYSKKMRFPASREDFGDDTWIPDPRIPDSIQIEDNELYNPARKFDRGHIVRRDDSVWGTTFQEAEFANSDTFHWTNCAPQHEDFNRHAFGKKGVWGGLEGHIAKQARAVDSRLIIFAGPVLDEARGVTHDFGGGRWRVPLDFWKVVVVPHKKRNQTRLKAFGFVMEQESTIKEFGLERKEFQVGKYEVIQRPIAAISKMTGVVFPKEVLDADTQKDASTSSALTLTTLEDLKV